MEITKESWDALVGGQMNAFHACIEYRRRLRAMAKQVEKLSWMLEDEVTAFAEFYEDSHGLADGKTLEEDIEARFNYLERTYPNAH